MFEITVIVVGIGITLFFVGSLIAVLTALGNKQYVFGIATLLFFPLSLIYCALNWSKAAYPGKMVYGGAALCLLSYIALIIFQPSFGS